MRGGGWLLALCAIGGCSREPLSDGDAVDASIDLARRPDLVTAPTRDGGDCSRFSLEPMAIEEFWLIDGDANLHRGAAIRIAVVTHSEAACAAPATLSWKVTPADAADRIDVLARRWHVQQSEPCADQPSVVNQVMVLGDGDGLSRPKAIVSDASPMGAAPITLSIGPPFPDADCAKVAPLGGDCAVDCQCQASDARARCVPTAPTSGTCAISCSADADCPLDRPFCINRIFELNFVCESHRDGPTCSMVNCRPGESCDIGGNRCVPMEEPAGGQPCACGFDCPGDLRCSSDGECFNPCTADVDCVGPATHCADSRCQ